MLTWSSNGRLEHAVPFPLARNLLKPNPSLRQILAGRIREGYRPHPRHWEALAELVGVSAVNESMGA